LYEFVAALLVVAVAVFAAVAVAVTITTTVTITVTVTVTSNTFGVSIYNPLIIAFQNYDVKNLTINICNSKNQNSGLHQSPFRIFYCIL